MDLRTEILTKLLIIPAILIGFTVHEYAHAMVADKLGDKTPRRQGRLTLNPLTHIDILGFIAILLVGIGWAKPVETNPGAYKHRYKDDLKVSLAGPLSNLGTALVFGMLYGIFYKYMFNVGIDVGLYRILRDIIGNVVIINCMLFIFNLIPVPGLDGFHILRDLSPKTFYSIEEKMYRYQLIILLLLITVAGRIISVPVGLLTNLFINII